MKIINDGLTLPLYQAVLNAQADYSPGEADISTTTLIGPSWIRHLTKKHGGELEIPASSQLYMLDGTAMHSIMERAGEEIGWIAEKRYYADVNGVKIGGQIDAYDPESKDLYDYKRSFVSQYMYGTKPEHEAQLNVNGWLMEQNGVEVEGIKISYNFKDFRKAKVAITPGYPEKMEGVVSVDRWEEAVVYQYILDRLAAHETPQPCTGTEKWAKFAVLKEGAKRALKIAETEHEAYAWIAEKVDQHELPYISVVEREPGRCEHYCRVNIFCPWWQENKEKYVK